MKKLIIFFLITAIAFSTGCSCSGDEKQEKSVIPSEPGETKEEERETLYEMPAVNKLEEECLALKEEVSDLNPSELIEKAHDNIRKCGEYGIESTIEYRASELIKAVYRNAAVEVEQLAVPISGISLEDIRGVYSKVDKKNRVVNGLKGIGGSGHFYNMPYLRVCEKTRDLVHFRLKDLENNEISSLFSESKEILGSKKVCSDLLNEVSKWEEFYDKCIVNRSCLEYSDISVEFSKRDTGNVIDDFKKWWNEEKVKISIEHVHSSGKVDPLKDIVSEKGSKWTRSQLPVTSGDKVKVSIVRNVEEKIKVLGSVEVPVTSFFCRHNPEVGKVKTLESAIEDHTKVEVRVKVDNIEEIKCPWNV